MRHVLPILVLIVAACAEEPVSPHRDDVVSACAGLRALGCPEGNGVLGGDTCEVIIARRHTIHPLDLACFAGASDVAAARKCGSLRCQR